MAIVQWKSTIINELQVTTQVSALRLTGFIVECQLEPHPFGDSSEPAELGRRDNIENEVVYLYINQLLITKRIYQTPYASED